MNRSRSRFDRLHNNNNYRYLFLTWWSPPEAAPRGWRSAEVAHSWLKLAEAGRRQYKGCWPLGSCCCCSGSSRQLWKLLQLLTFLQLLGPIINNKELLSLSTLAELDSVSYHIHQRHTQRHASFPPSTGGWFILRKETDFIKKRVAKCSVAVLEEPVSITICRCNVRAQRRQNDTPPPKSF